MSVEIVNQSKQRVPVALLQRSAEKFLRVNKVASQTISLVVCDQALIKKLNRQYRGLNKPTDVLSFTELGEIFLCPAVIAKQAKTYGHSQNEELVFILIHGLLHLLGYDDDTAKAAQRMLQLGQDFLNKYYDQLKKSR